MFKSVHPICEYKNLVKKLNVCKSFKTNNIRYMRLWGKYQSKLLQSELFNKNQSICFESFIQLTRTCLLLTDITYLNAYLVL